MVGCRCDEGYQRNGNGTACIGKSYVKMFVK